MTAPPSSLPSPEDQDTAPVKRAEPWLGVSPSIGLDTLPGRDLDKRELLELACSVAADPALWRRHVLFSDDRRHYVSLHRDAHVDVWVLCWTPSNDTGWHDHDISSGAVAVTQGALVEHNLAVGVPSLATEVPAGQVYCFGPDHIHRLTGLDAGSVSIHAYSPPLWRMGQYTVSRTGILRRTSVSYADELRPLDDMA
ncbi:MULTISPECIES: cysteine dioxygenase [Streptomycetaceae]|uniref:cysteine dioxygenase n=1 Tax=Streptomycetaceae TaxID=2062 RepID=UPI00300B969D